MLVETCRFFNFPESRFLSCGKIDRFKIILEPRTVTSLSVAETICTTIMESLSDKNQQANAAYSSQNCDCLTTECSLLNLPSDIYRDILWRYLSVSEYCKLGRVCKEMSNKLFRYKYIWDSLGKCQNRMEENSNQISHYPGDSFTNRTEFIKQYNSNYFRKQEELI